MMNGFVENIPRTGRIVIGVVASVAAVVLLMNLVGVWDDFLLLFPKKLIRRIASRSRAMYPVLLIALFLQLLIPGIKRSPKPLTPEFWLDIYYWYQSAILKVFGVFFVFTWINTQLWKGAGPWLPWMRDLPFALQVVIALWLKDLIVYWRHRVEHTPILWSFHAVHHSSLHVDVLTTHRLHPLELAFGILVNAPIAFVGFDPAAVALAFTIYGEWNHFIHMNIKVRMPGFLKYIFVTPFMHQWHHAYDKESIGKNVGVVFAWNDWIFGSAYHPDHWPSKFGFSSPAGEELPPANLLRHWLYPLQFLVARVSSWSKASAPPSR